MQANQPDMTEQQYEIWIENEQAQQLALEQISERLGEQNKTLKSIDGWLRLLWLVSVLALTVLALKP